MNKLIERLSIATHRFGNESQEQATIRRNQAIQDAIKALEAADQMAAVLALIDPTSGKQFLAAEALTAYRNLTQETPNDVH